MMFQFTFSQSKLSAENVVCGNVVFGLVLIQANRGFNILSLDCIVHSYNTVY